MKNTYELINQENNRGYTILKNGEVFKNYYDMNSGLAIEIFAKLAPEYYVMKGSEKGMFNIIHRDSGIVIDSCKSRNVLVKEARLMNDRYAKCIPQMSIDAYRSIIFKI